MNGSPGPRRLARDSILYAAAGALGKAFALFTVPLLTRTLGPEQYGAADLAVAVSFLATIVASFSGDIAAGQLAAHAPSDGARRAVMANWIAATVLIGGLLAAVAAPFSESIAAVLWGTGDRAVLALLAIVLIPVAAAQAALTNVLRLEGRPFASAGTAIIDLLAQIVLGVTLVLLGGGAVGLIGGYVLGSTLGMLVAAAAAWRHIRGAVNLTGMARVVRVGLPFLPAAVLFIAAEYIVRSVVLASKGDVAVGQLAVAIRLANAMGLISAAFSLAWGPLGLAQRFEASTARRFGLVFQAFALGSAVIAISAGALAPELVRIISGDRFVAAGQALPGLLLAAAMSGLFYVQTIAAGVQERTRGVPVASLVGAVTQVAVTFLTVPALGLLGVGIGALAGRSAGLAILGYETRSALHIDASTSVIVLGSIVLAVILGVLNQHEDTTLAARLVVLGIGLCSTVVAWQWRLRPRLSSGLGG